MTIQEAINSGKKFKHFSNAWITNYPDSKCFRLRWADSGKNIHINSDELLSTYWEVLVCDKHNVATDMAWNSYLCVDCIDECNTVHFTTKRRSDGYEDLVAWPSALINIEDSLPKKCVCEKWAVINNGCKCGGA